VLLHAAADSWRSFEPLLPHLPPLRPAFFETVIAENLKVPARVWKATFEGLIEAVPATETAAIAVPTLVIWGDRDRFLPRDDQEALAAAIDGARLAIYEGAGHAVHWEEPERVAADIVALTQQIRPGTRPEAS
jgi:non-heme chloroperoxidase